MGDFKGYEVPDELVVISGHLDNAPAGLGAQDDGIALIISMNSIRLLQHLDLTPRRTIRAILWGSEEIDGYVGTKAYAKHHAAEGKSGKHIAALEADHGCLGVLGFLASKPNSFRCVLHEILSLFQSDYVVYNVQKYYTDVTDLELEFGTPFADLDGSRSGRYRWYYHSKADTINSILPEEADECLAVYAATAYILADMENIPFRRAKNNK